MAIPRVRTADGAGEGLPQPLAPSQAARIRRVFDLQARGANADAARETDLLTDRLLLAHILADRYLGRSYRSSAAELAGWLARYAAEPDAPAIHALLLRRLQPGSVPPPAPQRAALAPAADDPPPLPEDAARGIAVVQRNPLLDRTVGARVDAGNAASALRLIAATRGIRPVYATLLRAEVARSLFTRNADAEALDVAAAAFSRAAPGERVGLAGYVAGLAAWRLGRHDLSRGFFEGATEAELTSSALRAAAAFWAGRAHLRAGDPAGYAPWMKRAAEEPRTFYGLLARRTLGIGGGFAWDRETLSAADLDAVAATPEGLRAFALLQIRQPDRAEAELRGLWPAAQDDPGLRNAVLLVAREAGMTDLAAQLATIVQAMDGKPRDGDRFPVPRLRPRNGFRVDPALVYALTRLESNFDPHAVSPVGARGLMQLMPVTAGYIAGDPSLAASGARLHDPAFNLELGQRYVSYLAGQEVIGGDLIRVLASYNAGPGNFARWSSAMNDCGDPLMFIEAIPFDETRAFVQHALAYTWTYAMRLRLPAPSLDRLAAGAFPRFTVPAKAELPAERLARVH